MLLKKKKRSKAILIVNEIRFQVLEQLVLWIEADKADRVTEYNHGESIFDYIKNWTIVIGFPLQREQIMWQSVKYSVLQYFSTCMQYMYEMHQVFRMKLGAVFERGLVAQQESFSPTSLSSRHLLVGALNPLKRRIRSTENNTR